MYLRLFFVYSGAVSAPLVFCLDPKPWPKRGKIRWNDPCWKGCRCEIFRAERLENTLKCPWKISDQPSGPRGLGFESRHSDQKKKNRQSLRLPVFLVFSMLSSYMPIIQKVTRITFQPVFWPIGQSETRENRHENRHASVPSRRSIHHRTVQIWSWRTQKT